MRDDVLFDVIVYLVHLAMFLLYLPGYIMSRIHYLLLDVIIWNPDCEFVFQTKLNDQITHSAVGIHVSILIHPFSEAIKSSLTALIAPPGLIVITIVS